MVHELRPLVGYCLSVAAELGYPAVRIRIRGERWVFGPTQRRWQRLRESAPPDAVLRLLLAELQAIRRAWPREHVAPRPPRAYPVILEGRWKPPPVLNAPGQG
ncbi:MAG: hypothetical protein WD556_09355 [Actinomycetota bacterium]